MFVRVASADGGLDLAPPTPWVSMFMVVFCANPIDDTTMSTAKNTTQPIRDPTTKTGMDSIPPAKRILAQRTATSLAGTPVCGLPKIGFVQIDTWRG